MYFSHGTTHNKGVTVLFNSKFECDIKACKIDQNGRYIILDLETQGKQMVIVNACAPCSSKPKEQGIFWDNLRASISSIQDLDEKFLIMGGDYNVLMNINLDRYGGNPRHD